MTETEKPQTETIKPEANPALATNLRNLDGVDDLNMVKICYGLYLGSLLFFLTSLVGLVLAYMKRPTAEKWLETHYTYLIRTFWISLLYLFIGCATAIFIIGFVIIIATCIFWIARLLIGANYIYKNEPIPNPETWLV